jgi:anti-sigma B factor antagonist
MPINPDTFTIHKEDGILRLEALDDLSASHVSAQQAFLKTCLDQAGEAVVLDLRRAELVDSLGITLLLGLWKSCKEKGLAFRVEGVNAEISRLFHLFSLDRVFEFREGQP